MSVSKEQVLATARLARLDLCRGLDPETADAALDRLAAQMDEIVAYMDILNRVDTTKVEPLYSPMRHTAPPRQDVACRRLEVAEVLANAPARQDDFFAVPPVIS